MGPTPFRRALFLSLTAASWLGKGLSTQEFERDVCEFKVSGPSDERREHCSLRDANFRAAVGPCQSPTWP